MKCMFSVVIVLLIAVLALTGYNYWQMNRMKTELASIRGRVHSDEAPAGGKGDLLTALASARKHAERAKELVNSGRTERAQVELDKSLRALEDASNMSQDIAADAGHGLGAAWSAVKKEVETAWDQVSKQSLKGKPEGNSTDKGE